jgi:integrase
MWQVNLESETLLREGRRVRVRPRRTFASVEEAREFAALKRIERKNRGALAVNMPERLRVDCLEAAEILRPFGVSLVEVARQYAARHELSHKSETVKNALTAFLATKQTDGARKRYLQDLRSRLGHFSQSFAERKVSDLSIAQLDSWLRDLGQSPVSRNTYHVRIHTFFEYCRTRGWLVTNPLKDLTKARVAQDASKIGILSVEEVARLLESADPATLPYWLFSIFCGLRASEVQRLEWKDLHWDEHLDEPLVEVPSAKSKTASRRFVALRPNLLQWLAPYREASGPVCPSALPQRLVADRQAAGITKWPPNACRHSFASYHLAHFRNPRELALEMGHTKSEVTFRHYRELVRPSEAQRFWKIVPSISASEIVAVA